MPTYIMLSRLTSRGVQTLNTNPDRLREVNHDVEELGAKVLHQWACLGPFDFVNVVEAPDAETMARVSVALGARASDQGAVALVDRAQGRHERHGGIGGPPRIGALPQLGCPADQLHRDPGLLGAARPGRDDDAVAAAAEHFGDGDLIVAAHLDAGAEREAREVRQHEQHGEKRERLVGKRAVGVQSGAACGAGVVRRRLLGAGPIAYTSCSRTCLSVFAPS